MLSAIGIVPSAPLLVPELAGPACAHAAELTSAVLAAGALLPSRWIAIGTGPVDRVVDPTAAGSFGGFGVDVPVRLAPDAGQAADLPLCALIAGWVRGQARPEGATQVRVFGGQHAAETAIEYGRALRVEIDRAPDPVGVLVVADGANTLTPSAPGGFVPEDVEAQQILDDALAAGDVATLARLPEPIGGRVAFQVLAGLADPGPRTAKELYRGAPYGVGYFAGVWQP